MLLVFIVAGASVLANRYIAPIRAVSETVSDVATAYLLRDEPQSRDVVIVGVTEETLAAYPYRTPVNRAFLATLLKHIFWARPRAVVIDFLFDHWTDRDEDEELKRLLTSHYGDSAFY